MNISSGKTYVDLLVVDPTRLFSYWDVTLGEIEGERLLRMYRGSKPAADLVIGPTNNWYLQVDPLNFYFVELIAKRAGGEVVLARSRTVRTPPDNFSESTEEEWLEVVGGFRRYFFFLLKRIFYSSFFKKKIIKEEWLLRDLFLKKKVGYGFSSDYLRMKK